MGKTVKTLVFSAVGIAVVAVTLVVFFVGYGARTVPLIAWWSLAFLLFSELALFISVILVCSGSGSAAIMRTGIITTFCIYWVLMLLSAFLSPLIFSDDLNAFIIIQVILVTVALILGILFAAMASSLRRREIARSRESVLLESCEKLAFSIVSNAAYHQYAGVLNKLYDEIRFSDKTVSLEEDEVIFAQLSGLEELLKAVPPAAVTAVSQKTDGLLALIAGRNDSVKRMKRAN